MRSRVASERLPFLTSRAPEKADQLVFELATQGVLPETEDILAEVHVVRYFLHSALAEYDAIFG